MSLQYSNPGTHAAAAAAVASPRETLSKHLKVDN